MPELKAVVTAFNMMTAYSLGVDPCWEGLLARKTAIRRFNRFETENFQSPNVATVPGLDIDKEDSLVMQMLRPLLLRASPVIPPDAVLILATTTGEIDILEKSVLDGSMDAADSRLERLLNKVQEIVGITKSGMIISAACASSSGAIAQAAAMIRRGEHDCVLIVACDSITEFVFSGFSALMALDKDIARPFDKDRSGLSIGEAAGFVVLMSGLRAAREKRRVFGEVAGWGITCDANHMTGPSRDGSGLASAIYRALEKAGVSCDEVGCIAAHGTGTVYNDSMEMKAFKKVFGANPIPTYSIKGGAGHMMGATGLVEMIVALISLREKVVPSTINCREVDDEAKGWVKPDPCAFNSGVTVSTNSGFGGINTALVLTT